MLLFVSGLVLFLGTHFFTAFARSTREQAVGSLSENGYKGLYSVIALIGFVLIIVGWPNASVASIYSPPYFLRHVTYLLMLPAVILLVSAYAPAGRIAAMTKHPMITGVKIWAFAHLLSNGDLRSVLLFGGFLVFAVFDRIAVKRRNAPTRKAGPVMNDIIVIVVGLAGYAAILFYLHPYIAGVPLQ